MYWLGKALLQLGHRVTLIAHPDSHLPGADLRPLSDSIAADGSWVKLIPDSTDILHLRSRPKYPLPKPHVVTVGGNGHPEEMYDPNTIFLSRRHALNHGSEHFVHNGVDPGEYQFSAERDSYAVFLAKASWDVKNLRGAIEVCRRAGVELHVIGSRNWPLDLHRWLPKIRNVCYHGTLGQREKVPLLAKARCLVFPVRWHEPFGNAVNEALVSGCFIAGTPYGALPEIVTPEAGFLSNRADELAEIVSCPTHFSPAQCRDRVLQNFTHLQMARKYLEYYERVLTTGSVGGRCEATPRTAPGFVAKRLLDWFP
jgi:glycosyltransferase involved in cell wall biosynthesis